MLSRRILLICGIAAPLLFTGMTLLVGLLWDGYSAASQTISELSAIDAPTRPLWILLSTVYTVMMFAFGWMVWTSAPANRPLRIVGALVMTQTMLAIFWPPMHQRAVLAAGGSTLTDTLHLVWAAVTGLLFMSATAVGAAALGKRFHVYSIATLVILFACGALTGTYTSAIQANLPTPWAGAWERVSSAAFMLWVAVLATALLRDPKWRQTMSHASAFKTPEGETAFLAAYGSAMKRWPVPYTELDVPTRFGTTHVIVSGPKTAPPLVLLHGYMATSTMWAPNVADFAKHYRVYAIDVMGQPGKSVPAQPIASAADYAAWLTATLDALRLDRVFLVGMSFGGWVALTCAVRAPERIKKVALLSPGGPLPLSAQFSLRGMLMTFFPTRVTVNWFMHWLGITDDPGETDASPVLNLMYLGLKHFRVPPETLRVMPTPLSDDELRGLRMPVLLLIGEDEVIYDPIAALARARRLVPDFEGGLIPGCRHDMCFSQHRIVDARVLDFLRSERGGARQPRAA